MVDNDDEFWGAVQGSGTGVPDRFRAIFAAGKPTRRNFGTVVTELNSS